VNLAMLPAYSNSHPCPKCSGKRTARASQRSPGKRSTTEVWLCQECQHAFNIALPALTLREVKNAK